MFTVTGTGSDTYAITLTMPSASLASGANTMALTLLSSVGLTSTLSSGTQTFYVGGTLTVGPSQVAGNYTSSGFTVAVNYN
jgi:hypothetical protein